MLKRIKEQSLLKYKINSDSYKTEIIEGKENIIINVHNVNIFENES